MSQGLRAEHHISATHTAEQRENEADLAADMAEGVLGGTTGAPERHTAVARIGHLKAHKLDGEDAEGKLAHRYGLQAVPNFEQAIKQKLNKTHLPVLKATEFWNSPAYQALFSQQEQVETDAELEARRAQLNSLMKRVAMERRVPLAHCLLYTSPSPRDS